VIRSIEAVAGSIRLQRDTHKGSFLLVEGRSDKKFYERFIDKDVCKVASISGKPSSKSRVITVLNSLETSGFKGVLAIVDMDFDNLLAVPLRRSTNLFLTDYHDLETMLVQSPAFDQVLAEFYSEEKIKLCAQDVRMTVLKAGTTVGYLRWISQRDDLNLKFSTLSFGKFVNSQNLEINQECLIEEVLNKTPSSCPAISDIQNRLNEAYRDEHDPWQLCCGHDLVNILSLGLRQLLGSNKAVEVAVNSLERCLRLAYEKSDWLETQLYSDICEWERANPPFRVFEGNHT